MSEYHKIQSVFMREPKGARKFIEGAWTMPEFDYLKDCLWRFTEKVDGMNIRVIVTGDVVKFAGRTDNAAIPPALLERLQERFPSRKCLQALLGNDAVLYGEGYGGKIQAGGKYRQDPDFVLFDVRVNDRWWLSDEQVRDIAGMFGCDVVPTVGIGTLTDAMDIVRGGLKSRWGDFPAEGVVARPMIELQTRSGKRIITKIKTRDFADAPKP